MAVEADAIARLRGIGRLKRGGLANIVQQHAPGERGGGARRKMVEQHQGVGPDIALGMVLRGLLHALHARDLGQDLYEQAGAIKQLEGAPGVAFGEHAGQLVADALVRDLCELARMSRHGGHGRGFDLEAEPGGEADAAQHAQLVLGEAEIGGADGAEKAAGEVGASANKVEHPFVQVGHEGIEQHAVDGEVAARYIFAGVERETHGVRAAAVQVGAVVAEGCDLGGWALLPQHKDDAEVRAHLQGAGEERGDLRRGGIGGDVEVLGLDAEEQIADAAAGEEGRVAGMPQRPDDAAGDGLSWRVGELRGGGHPVMRCAGGWMRANSSGQGHSQRVVRGR